MIKAKYRILYPTYPDPNYARAKVKYSYDRVKPGTLSVLETVTEEKEVPLVEEGGKKGYEYEVQFLTRAAHQDDAPVTGLPWSREGLVLELLFTEGKGDIAYDTSGYENHGKIYGAKWVEGPIGGALHFDGQDDYVEVPIGELDIPLRSWTVEVLFMPYELIPPTDVGSIVGFSYTLRLDYTSSRLQVLTRTSDGSWHGATYTTDVLYKWWYLVGVRSETEISLYVNGDRVASKDLPDLDDRRVSNRYFKIGNNAALEENRWAHGYIAFARIYNRALTEDEIRAHYEYVRQFL